MQQIYLREQCRLNYFVFAEYKLFTLAYNIAVYCYMIVCLFHCMDNIILYYVETIVFNKKYLVFTSITYYLFPFSYYYVLFHIFM